MATVFSTVVNYASAWVKQKIATIDQDQIIRGAGHAASVSYFVFQFKTKPSSRFETLAAFTAGFFLTAAERNSRLELVNVVSWDLDEVVASENPFYYGWFPAAITVNSLFPRFFGGDPHRVLNDVICMKAGVAVFRTFSRELLVSRKKSIK